MSLTTSPPARVAWIETCSDIINLQEESVATREGGVDRNNKKPAAGNATKNVATREGGVDRNSRVRGRGNGASYVATREGGVDRNVRMVLNEHFAKESPPARVAWIETNGKTGTVREFADVATREGGVDRNTSIDWSCDFWYVATREGGVDRNDIAEGEYKDFFRSPPARVAWIETQKMCPCRFRHRSPPARVAWIETDLKSYIKKSPPSPPARVAWIETSTWISMVWEESVATREGGVDRNRTMLDSFLALSSRHPRGWRG